MSNQDKGKGRATTPAHEVPEIKTTGEVGASESTPAAYTAEYEGYEHEATSAPAAGASGANSPFELSQEERDALFQKDFEPPASDVAATATQLHTSNNLSSGQFRTAGPLAAAYAANVGAPVARADDDEPNISSPAASLPQCSGAGPQALPGASQGSTSITSIEQRLSTNAYGHGHGTFNSSDHEPSYDDAIWPGAERDNDARQAVLDFPSASSGFRPSSRATRQPVPGSTSNLSCLPPYRHPVFADWNAASLYLAQKKWKPSFPKYGTPTTQRDLEKCKAKIYGALIDIDTVWDADAHPADLVRFCVGGDWSNPDDLEAMAACILKAFISFQEEGFDAGEQAIRLPGDSREPKANDVVFTFHQRLHCTTLLLKHFKSWANRFMCGVGLKAHVARIWSVLLMERAFEVWWMSLDSREQRACFEQHPYEGMTWSDQRLHHPTAPVAPAVAGQNYLQAQSGGPSTLMPISSRAAGKRPMVEDPAAEAGPSSKRRLVETSTPQAPQQQGGHSSVDVQSLVDISSFFAKIAQAGTAGDNTAVPQDAPRDAARAGAVEGAAAIPTTAPQPTSQADQEDETWWNENIAEETLAAGRADAEVMDS